MSWIGAIFNASTTQGDVEGLETYRQFLIKLKPYKPPGYFIYKYTFFYVYVKICILKYQSHNLIFKTEKSGAASVKKLQFLKKKINRKNLHGSCLMSKGKNRIPSLKKKEVRCHIFHFEL